jgi:tetratricopeptide (TPR) repeat protein
LTASRLQQFGFCLAAIVMAVMTAPACAQGQMGNQIHGFVRDARGEPVANAAVFLELSPGNRQVTHTDSAGMYHFDDISSGTYTLRAEMNGYVAAASGPVNLTTNDARTIDVKKTDVRKIDLVLGPSKSPEPTTPATTPKPAGQDPEFFDEPRFTVAGVTQATNAGGHGSDTVLRASESLAKATVSLGKESTASSGSAAPSAESSLREELARQPNDLDGNRQLGTLLAAQGKYSEALPYLQQASRIDDKDAEIHRLQGEVEEKLGNPLEAVREYQRAATLNPSEVNLFDWGTELLAHRAFEPATDVLTDGNRRFPKSVRMQIALGVAWYARGADDQAARCLEEASDMAPDDATPYLFLGRMQTAKLSPLDGALQRFARFEKSHPDSALAKYYYALSIWRQSPQALDNETSARLESLLMKAVQLDPKLSAAHLLLGTVYSQRGDTSQAISSYQKAAEVGSELEDATAEAHYRLARLYSQIGDKKQAEAELQLHAMLTKKTKEDSDRERRQIQEFVITLQDKSSPSPPH